MKIDKTKWQIYRFVSLRSGQTHIELAYANINTLMAAHLLFEFANKNKKRYDSYVMIPPDLEFEPDREEIDELIKIYGVPSAWEQFNIYLED